jgi:hypothetical protein
VYTDPHYHKFLFAPEAKRAKYAQAIGQPSINQLEQDFGIELIGLPETNLCSVIDHLKKDGKLEQFLVEAGVSTTSKYYLQNDVEKNPIDTLVLHVMVSGEKLNPLSVGPPFPTFD